MDSPSISLSEAARGEIKAEIARRGLGQKLLADAWGITQPSVSDKLAGRSQLTGDDIDSAARALGYDPFDFVARAKRNAHVPNVPSEVA